jgi:hypothetical protein
MADGISYLEKYTVRKVKYFLQVLARKGWRRNNSTKAKRVKQAKEKISQVIQEKTKEESLLSWSGNHSHLIEHESLFPYP